MSELLDRLQTEHHRIGRLLDLLTGLLDHFHDGDEPDYELMCELIEYLTDYSDQIHHPSEDMLFERVIAVSGQGEDLLRRLMHEHVALSQFNHRFKESLEGIVHEEVMRRDEVEQQGRELVGLMRGHLRCEDLEAFPLARAALSDADLAELAAAAPTANDPVFGRADPARFRALYLKLRDQV